MAPDESVKGPPIRPAQFLQRRIRGGRSLLRGQNYAPVRRGERGAPILPSAAAASEGSYPIIDRHAAIQVKSDSKIKPALTTTRDALGSRPFDSHGREAMTP